MSRAQFLSPPISQLGLGVSPDTATSVVVRRKRAPREPGQPDVITFHRVVGLEPEMRKRALHLQKIGIAFVVRDVLAPAGGEETLSLEARVIYGSSLCQTGWSGAISECPMSDESPVITNLLEVIRETYEAVHGV